MANETIQNIAEETIETTKKTITFTMPDVFKEPVKGEIILEEHGQRVIDYVKQTAKIDINLSSILCRLIKIAAHRCDHYCSDLFISWESFLKIIKNPGFGTHIALLGFRDSGVDGNGFMQCRMTNAPVYGKDIYSEIYALIATEDPKQTGTNNFPEVYLVALDSYLVKKNILPPNQEKEQHDQP